MAYVRTVKTASGAVAVQIVHADRRGSREIEHIGSAHSPGEVEVLKTVARQRLHANQDVLDFDDAQPGEDDAPILAAGVTVIADAGMMSEANCKDLEDAGLTFILAAKIPDVPYQVKQWLGDHPRQAIPDQQVFVQPTVTGPKTDPRRRTILYQYRADRARRTPKGIDTQIAKAEKAIASNAAVKRNRFVQLTGAKKAINRELEAKARALAGLKGYVTNLPEPTPEFLLGAYHQLWQIETSFRMSRSDLRARPIYHHKRDSIEAHLTIVMAALAVSRWLNARPAGQSRRSWTLRPHRSIAVQLGSRILRAGTPLDDQARAIITAVNNAADAH